MSAVVTAFMSTRRTGSPLLSSSSTIPGIRALYCWILALVAESSDGTRVATSTVVSGARSTMRSISARSRSGAVSAPSLLRRSLVPMCRATTLGRYRRIVQSLTSSWIRSILQPGCPS